MLPALNGSTEEIAAGEQTNGMQNGTSINITNKAAMNTTTNLSAELAQASTNFKANPGFRQEAAKKLIPLIKQGMNTNEVKALLGPPSSITENGQSWDYVLFYSQVLFVKYDTNNLVEKIEPPYKQ